MAHEITSGEFTYGRTRNLGDYNSKKAEVKLAFSVEKNDHAAALATVTKVAIDTCEAILDGKPVPAFLTQQPAGASTGDKSKLEAEALTAAGAAPKAAKTRAAKPPAVEAVKTEEKLVAAKPAEAAPVEADPLGDDLMGAAEAEITDADLQHAVTTKNQQIQNPQAIRKLIGEFVTHPQGARDIPAKLRKKFLEKLNALQGVAA